MESDAAKLVSVWKVGTKDDWKLEQMRRKKGGFGGNSTALREESVGLIGWTGGGERVSTYIGKM